MLKRFGGTRFRLAGAAALLGLAGLAMVGCGSSSDAPDVRISVTAQVLGTDPRISAEATELAERDGGVWRHDVVVTWDGDDPVVLDDARFVHHVKGPDGSLVIAGRGCGAQWEGDELMQACTADLQIIRLDPGGSHPYPVAIHTSVGPLRLTPGIYIVDETIGWWDQSQLGEGGIPSGQSMGSFVVRLTYTVEDAP